MTPGTFSKSASTHQKQPPAKIASAWSGLAPAGVCAALNTATAHNPAAVSICRHDRTHPAEPLNAASVFEPDSSALRLCGAHCLGEFGECQTAHALTAADDVDACGRTRAQIDAEQLGCIRRTIERRHVQRCKRRIGSAIDVEARSAHQ